VDFLGDFLQGIFYKAATNWDKNMENWDIIGISLGFSIRNVDFIGTKTWTISRMRS
jgi:hypothetical protein